MKILLAATVAALLAPAAALANAPAPAALPDFPPDARPGECWARAPMGELAGGPAAAPAPGQHVWTLKRGHGPEAVWRFDVRPVPGAPLMAEPRFAGPYQWVRVACQPGDVMARTDAPPAPHHAMPHHSAPRHAMPPQAGVEHHGAMQHHGGMEHHRGMQHHEGMTHHQGMQGHVQAGPPPHAYHGPHGPRPEVRAFRFERRMPPPHGFDAPPPGFDGPPPHGFQGPPPPMAFAPPPSPYPEQPPRWFGDRFLSWSGKTW